MSTTHLKEHVAVGCPIERAQARIEEFFAQRRGADGVARLTLRVPLDDAGALSGLALEHAVAVRARRDRDEQNLNDLVRIDWEAEGGGPYPRFEGTLVTWAEHDPNETFVEIEGAYTPPLGMAGELFDAAVGRAIAQRTARALLGDLGRAIEVPGEPRTG